MRQAVCQDAVIREEEQSGRIFIETPDGEDFSLKFLREKIEYGEYGGDRRRRRDRSRFSTSAPSVPFVPSVNVIRDNPHRLLHDIVQKLRSLLDHFSFHFNGVLFRICFLSQGRHLPIHPHQTRKDVLLSLAARANTASREDLLKSFEHRCSLAPHLPTAISTKINTAYTSAAIHQLRMCRRWRKSTMQLASPRKIPCRSEELMKTRERRG